MSDILVILAASIGQVLLSEGNANKNQQEKTTKKTSYHLSCNLFPYKVLNLANSSIIACDLVTYIQRDDFQLGQLFNSFRLATKSRVQNFLVWNYIPSYPIPDHRMIDLSFCVAPLVGVISRYIYKLSAHLCLMIIWVVEDEKLCQLPFFSSTTPALCRQYCEGGLIDILWV